MKDFIADNLDNIIAYLFGAGGFFSWLSEKRKRRISALSGMQEAYDKFVEDSDKKFEDMRKEISSLKVTHAQQVQELKKKIKEIETFWSQKYNALKKAFDNYKKSHP